MRTSRAPHRRATLIPSLAILLFPAIARAGMPSFTFTDIAGARLQTISFFLLVFLLSAGAVKLIWNYLRRDFPRLPCLNYLRALALISVWGLVFILVLTMISGARELMTPGAWVKNGATYKLSAGNPQDSQGIWNQIIAQRQSRLEDLRAALWSYANQHGGLYPPDDHPPEIPSRIWETPDLSHARYFYVKGHQSEVGNTPLAYEPAIFKSARLVLYTNGQIRETSESELRSALDHPTTQKAP